MYHLVPKDHYMSAQRKSTVDKLQNPMFDYFINELGLCQNDSQCIQIMFNFVDRMERGRCFNHDTFKFQTLFDDFMKE